VPGERDGLVLDHPEPGPVEVSLRGRTGVHHREPRVAAEPVEPRDEQVEVVGRGSPCATGDGRWREVVAEDEHALVHVRRRLGAHAGGDEPCRARRSDDAVDPYAEPPRRASQCPGGVVGHRCHEQLVRQRPQRGADDHRVVVLDDEPQLALVAAAGGDRLRDRAVEVGEHGLGGAQVARGRQEGGGVAELAHLHRVCSVRAGTRSSRVRPPASRTFPAGPRRAASGERPGGG
jgi:hypothetical protein